MKLSSIIYLILPCIFCVLNSCARIDFYDFETPETSFQIFPGKKDLLRIVRTNGEGPYTLQLFNANGNLEEAHTVATPEPFAMTKFDDHTLEICYFVSNMQFFPNWFKNYKDNPKEIGDYKITYTYVAQYSFGIDLSTTIDSLVFNNEGKKVSLFYKRKLISTVPVQWNFIYRDKLRYYNSESKETIEFRFANNAISRKYLKGILDMSK